MPTVTTQISIRMPPPLAKALKSQAAAERRTINAILNHIIEEYLAQHGSLPKSRKEKVSS